MGRPQAPWRAEPGSSRQLEFDLPDRERETRRHNLADSRHPDVRALGLSSSVLEMSVAGVALRGGLVRLASAVI